jgi:hypothetical protein
MPPRYADEESVLYADVETLKRLKVYMGYSGVGTCTSTRRLMPITRQIDADAISEIVETSENRNRRNAYYFFWTKY